MKNKEFCLKIFDAMLVIFVVWTCFNDISTFDLKNCDTKHFIVYTVIKCMFIFSVFFAKYLIVNYHKKIKISNQEGYPTFYKILALFLLVNTIAFLIFFPGNYNNVDEINILNNVINLNVWSVQSLTMNLIYYFGLMIYPKAFAVVLLQVLISSYIEAYIIYDVYFRLRQKKTILLFFVLFFSIPSIYFILFPLRAWIFTILLLLFLYKIFVTIRFKQSVNRGDIIGLCTLATLICVTRTEIKFLIFILPVILYMLYNRKIKDVWKKLGVAEVLMVSCILILNAFSNFAGGTNKTKTLEPFVTSLSIMAQQDRILEKDLQAIDKVMPVDDLIKYADYERPYGYQSGSRKDGEFTNAEYNAAFAVIVKNIVKNPDIFLKSKIFMFIDSTGIWEYYVNLPANIKHIVKMYDRFGFNHDRAYSLFDRFSPLRAYLRAWLAGNLLGHNLYKIVWAFWVPIVLMTVLALFMLIRYKEKFKAYMTVFSVTFIELLMVFIFAPATFQMYYFPFYIIGYFFVIFGIADIINGVIDKSSE